MMALYSILSGIIGGLAGVFPLSLEAPLVFWQKVNTTVYGTAGLKIGYDTVFLVYLGIFAALTVSYHEKIINFGKVIFDKSYINENESALLKEVGICTAFYIPAALFNIFFENSNFNSMLLCVFICLNTFVIYSADCIKKAKFNGKNAVIVPALGAFFGGFTGLSEIAFIFTAALMSGKKTNRAIQFSLLAYIPIVFIKTVIYLAKACAEGFTLNFWLSALVFATSFISAVFAVSILKKIAVKRNFRIFAYFTAAFAVIAVYTFIKG